MIHFSNETKNWILNNHTKISPNKMAQRLDVSRDVVLRYFKQLKIKPKNWSFKNNGNIDRFININDETTAYFIGFFFADGSIKNNVSIRTSFKRSDYETIKNIFPHFGKWKIYFSKRTNRQEQAHCELADKNLVKLFVDKHFKNKTTFQHILKHIPNELFPTFLLGFFDGDGSFYITNRMGKAEFAGPYNFDWSDLQNKLLGFNMQTQVKLKYNKTGKGSSLEMTNQIDVLKLGRLLYSGRRFEKLGFPRKFNKFTDIVRLCYEKWSKQLNYKCKNSIPKYLKQPHLIAKHKQFQKLKLLFQIYRTITSKPHQS